jgi:hypothetical protein
MYFNILLPFVCRILANLLVSKAHLWLWAKQLNMEAKRVSILDTRSWNSMFGQQDLSYVPYNAPHQQKGMLLHELGVDTIFHSLKNCNTISSKEN